MPIVPDSKDWTWVLDRRCPECGLDTTRIEPEDVPGLLDELTASWRDVLTGLGKDELATRPSDDRWSVLEYACHVRDVFVLFDERLHLMLERDVPTFANWDQDKTAEEDRYNEQDPPGVRRQLVRAGQALSASFATVREDQLSRTGTRSDGAHFTVETFGRYLVHDPVHHLHDVGRPFDSAPL